MPSTRRPPRLISILRLASLLCPAAGLISACDTLSSLFVHRICLFTPAPPPSWEELRIDGWRLVWNDTESREVEKVVSNGEGAWVEIERGEVQAILAYPQSGGIEFKPAGFLYPEELEPSGPWPWADESAVMSWDSGYSGEVARALAASGFAFDVFELSRLTKEARARGADPWDLAPWKAARALSGRSYRASLHPIAREDFILPGGEVWRSESPFKEVKGDGPEQAVKLAQGLSLFHSDRKSLLVDMGEEGARIMVWER